MARGHRCSAGMDNMGGTGWHDNGFELDYDYDRCRRFTAHAGPHVLDCGGAVDRDGDWIEGSFRVKSQVFDNWMTYVDYLIENHQLYV